MSSPIRDYVGEKLSGLLSFFDILSARQESDSKSMLAEVRGDVYESSSETYPDAEVWGVAGVQSWPKKDPDGSEGAQALVHRQGDECVVFATRDTRYQVSLEEGDVVVHALGKDGATQSIVRCKANGTVEIEGVNVKFKGDTFVGGDAASQFIALGDNIESHLSAIRAGYNAHTHPGDSGGTTGTTSNPIAAPSQPMKSSKHKVEP